ncbi:4'-phosphopantetheinyl transferase superfamily protein [Massilia sp. NR 4-1]|uniref:4'-phosphopantetheinyl transferase family protein n=1 Tax=Massilia sp. NR 4-1 TaxID=1678028 RepID=UPI0009E4ECE1|nr:4'-phosphopantetheinyl transferase superfamily protein [Massilia sp. NR 4-1]
MTLLHTPPAPACATALLDLRMLPLLAEQAAAIFWLPLVQVDEALFGTACALLSDAERRRLDSYRFQRNKLQHGMGRALLRLALARECHCAPREIELVPDCQGKPRMAAPEPIAFSISHCEGHVAVALSRLPRIGVDIEDSAAPQAGYDAVARRSFSAREYDWIRTADTGGFARFIELWTLKEAYLKALGAGLSKPMTDCEFLPGATAMQFLERRPECQAAGWHFAQYRVAPACRISLAVEASAPAKLALYCADARHGWQALDAGLLHSVHMPAASGTPGGAVA